MQHQFPASVSTKILLTESHRLQTCLGYMVQIIRDSLRTVWSGAPQNLLWLSSPGYTPSCACSLLLPTTPGLQAFRSVPPAPCLLPISRPAEDSPLLIANQELALVPSDGQSCHSRTCLAGLATQSNTDIQLSAQGKILGPLVTSGA